MRQKLRFAVIFLLLVLSACPRQYRDRSPCPKTPSGAREDFFFGRIESRPAFFFRGHKVNVGTLETASNGVPFLRVSSRGPLRLGDGRRPDGQVDGCLKLPPIATDAEASRGPDDDLTDGSCPVIHLPTIQTEVQSRLASTEIQVGLDRVKNSVSPDGIWVLWVSDWRHADRVTSALAEVIGTWRIEAQLGVAVEGPICEQLL